MRHIPLDRLIDNPTASQRAKQQSINAQIRHYVEFANIDFERELMKRKGAVAGADIRKIRQIELMLHWFPILLGKDIDVESMQWKLLIKVQGWIRQVFSGIIENIPKVEYESQILQEENKSKTSHEVIERVSLPRATYCIYMDKNEVHAQWETKPDPLTIAHQRFLFFIDGVKTRHFRRCAVCEKNFIFDYMNRNALGCSDLCRKQLNKDRIYAKRAEAREKRKTNQRMESK